MRFLAVALAIALASPAVAAERVKVLVLDVKSKDLSASEVETLTSLVTADLARYPQLDVLSSVDIKRLVDLEAQKQSVGCDQGACLAELAGAMGAQLVFFGQAGKLGTTYVVTLNVFDAAKNEAVGRQPIQAQDISQIPALVGPAVDAMIQPLFSNLRTGGGGVKASGGGAIMGGGGGFKAPSSVNTANLGARAKEVYDQQVMDICVDSGDRLKWWFCDKKERYTENAFVRKYREMSGDRDLDKFEKNRNPNGMLLPGVMIGGGTGLFLLGLPIAYYSYVDKTTVPVLSEDTGSGNGSIGGALSITAIAIGASVAVYGGILMMNALDFTDGELTDHSMREPDAREAAGRYNEALGEKVEKEYGAP